jgi:hypothetical protein
MAALPVLTVKIKEMAEGLNETWPKPQQGDRPHFDNSRRLGGTVIDLRSGMA